MILDSDWLPTRIWLWAKFGFFLKLGYSWAQCIKIGFDSTYKDMAFSALCDNFRNCETSMNFLNFFQAHVPARIIITARINYDAADNLLRVGILF